jgi:2',3'-cyclic-nucleotide 2'-phosphodiesterase/3'-nucleotidase
VTGAQLRDYLEFSARYYAQVPAGAGVDPAKLTNAGGVPDYNYDVVGGVSYDVDVSRAPGSRIVDLSFEGRAVADGDRFVLAVDNYRANGGGNFPHIASARQVWADSEKIRNTIVSWVRANGEIDPARFASADWRLVREGVPVF